MTNTELNEYIKRYIENDKTNSAIMLTAPWGTGKSYYIKNELIPFLESEDGGKHECIVISLYGIFSIYDIGKCIYWENISQKAKQDSDTITVGVSVAKTVLKNFNINLEFEKETLNKMYKSVDLSGKLIIFEDIERAHIELLEFMGYVNNLTEQDNVRVLLVTNEEDIIKYNYETTEPQERNVQDKKTQGPKGIKKVVTEQTVKYKSIKEKSVIDTINYMFDYDSSIKGIISGFLDDRLNVFNESYNREDIYEIMCLMKSTNLRALQYACQKTIDIFDIFLSDKCYTKNFKEKIFYGNIFIALALKMGNIPEWNGDNYYSTEMFLIGFPIAKFCFDYILEQKVDKRIVKQTIIEFEKLRLFDDKKNNNDNDFNVLSNFHVHNDEEVIAAIASIKERLLKHKSEIAFANYPLIIRNLLEIKGYIEYDLDLFVNIMCKYLKEERENIPVSRFKAMLTLNQETDIFTEYKKIIKRFIAILEEKKNFLKDFDYQYDNLHDLSEYVLKYESEILENGGFLNQMEVEKFVDLFFSATPKYMEDIRGIFITIYDPYSSNTNGLKFIMDKGKITQLYENLKEKRVKIQLGGIQSKQYDMFIGNLEKILESMNE